MDDTQKNAERPPIGECRAILIAGPTASGKSALAVRIAQRLGADIINADSMQVYRDLSVLSARPSSEEQGGIPHRLFGFVDAGREFNVGDYLAAAAPFASTQPVVFVGGTGLYFRALTEGLVEAPPISDAVRDDVAARVSAGEDLHAALTAVDPASAARLSPNDLPRLERALAMYLTTGEPFSSWRQNNQGQPLLAPGTWRGIFLNPDRDTLYARIDRRFEAMMRQGALEEVRALVARGLPPNRGVMKAHGVPHLVRFLAGEISEAEAIRLGQQDTRNYAKRQLTWARKFMRDWSWAEDAEDACSLLFGGEPGSDS